MSLARSRVAFVFVFLTGCAGLIGIPDLTLDEEPGGGGSDGGSVDGRAGLDGDVTDTGARDASNDATPELDAGDGATCDVSRLATDAENCGRCGHSCLGSTCAAGVCAPTRLGVYSRAGLRFVAQHGDYVYFSTFWRAFGNEQGIYRVAKAGGPPEPYVVADYTQHLSIVGDKLYFLINDYPFEDAGPDGELGGVWSCDLTKPAPCVPTIEARAYNPSALAVANGHVYFTSIYADDDKIYAHALDAGTIDPTTAIGTHDNRSWTHFLWADPADVYSLGSRIPTANEHVFMTRYPVSGDGAEGAELSRYTSTQSNPGGLTASPTAIFYAAYDFEDTTGGAVKRVPRGGGTETACEFGAGAPKSRPAGAHVDATNVYWTNQGDFAPPYANGSVAYCPAYGACCATPTTLWTGDGEPVAITGDDQYIYWVGYRSGEIWKAPKP